MIQKTKGIVLRSIKYGETSLIVSIFTELLGLQSYMVNGVRTATKKGTPKANLFQPASLLDLVVYHNEFRNLQRLKEFKWAYLYQHIYADVPKNAVALFMVELLTKCVKEPETHAELFYFLEDALLHLDKANEIVTANFPLYFALHLPAFFGFKISDEYSDDKPYLDLEEGTFVSEIPNHAHYMEGKAAAITSHILKVMQPDELTDIYLNGELRRSLLQSYELYYALHIPEFGSLKTLPVLRDVMS